MPLACNIGRKELTRGAVCFRGSLGTCWAQPMTGSACMRLTLTGKAPQLLTRHVCVAQPAHRALVEEENGRLSEITHCEGEMECVKMRHLSGATAEVYLFGGTLTSWKTPDGSAHCFTECQRIFLHLKGGWLF